MTAQPENAWPVRAITALALLALVGYSAWQRWQALSVSPFPLGVDGYFYPIQLRSLMEQHTLQYPASPLTFWFMLPFAYATDPITGAKLGAAIGGALVALPAFGVGVRLGRNRGAGFVAAVMASQLAASQYLSMEFVKQGVGMTVALTAVWLVLRALEKPSNARIVVALLGFVAALATHKLAAALVVIVAVPGIIAETRGRGALRGRRLLYVILGLAVLGLVLAILGVVAPRRFLGEHDMHMLGDLVSNHPDWSMPALAIPAPPWAPGPAFRLEFDREALVGGIAALVAIAALIAIPYDRKEHGARIVSKLTIVLALAFAIPWLAVDDPQGLGYRLRLAAYVPAALCAAIAVGALASLIKGRVEALLRDAILLVGAAIALVEIPEDPAEGRVLMHPALVSAAISAQPAIPKNATVIVPERHLLFMVAYYTRAKVALHPEAVPVQERVRLMPLAFIGMDSPLDHALDAARVEPGVAPPLGLHSRYRNGLVLVAEPTWGWIVERIAEHGRTRNGLQLVGEPARTWILGVLGDPGGWWARWPTI